MGERGDLASRRKNRNSNSAHRDRRVQFTLGAGDNIRIEKNRIIGGTPGSLEWLVSNHRWTDRRIRVEIGGRCRAVCSSASAPENCAEFESGPPVSSACRSSEGETILAMNNKSRVLIIESAKRSARHCATSHHATGQCSGYGSAHRHTFSRPTIQPTCDQTAAEHV